MLEIFQHRLQFWKTARSRRTVYITHHVVHENTTLGHPVKTGTSEQRVWYTQLLVRNLDRCLTLWGKVGI